MAAIRGPLAHCKFLAVVTGANQGIGFEIVKALAQASVMGKKEQIGVIMGVRNLEKGRKAVDELQKDGVGENLELQQLDISSAHSIKDFQTYLAGAYGRLDVLVNNAGFAFKNADPTPFEQQARPTLAVNYYGTLRTTEALLPLLRQSTAPAAFVVNLASRSGGLSKFTGHVRDQLISENLTLAELNKMVESFVEQVESKSSLEGTGWPRSCYGVSKAAEIALTRILTHSERDFHRRHPHGTPVLAWSVCPGWCSTSMSSYGGPRSAAKGAETPAWLVTHGLEQLLDDANRGADPYQLLKPGGFWADKEELDWKKE